MTASADVSPGFYRSELDPDRAERLVIRFGSADVTAGPSEGSSIKLELHLRGSDGELDAWQPSIRRVEGLIIVADPEGRVQVAEALLRVPAGITDIEIHTRSGDIEVRGLLAGVVAETETGRVFVEHSESVEASTHSGDLRVEGVGQAELSSGSGPVRVSKARGKVAIRSTSGDVDLEDCAGDLFVDVKTGEVTVRRPGSRVMVQSQEGDIELEAGGPFGGGDIATTSGSISLDLGGANLELRTETLSGRLLTPQGEVTNAAGPRRSALSIGSGGRRLHAKSIEGDIEIEF